MKKEKFETRCKEMRHQQHPPADPPLSKAMSSFTDPVSNGPGNHRNIAYVSKALGVSYSTARRLLIAENVGRYSGTTGEGPPVYPGTPVKRFQRVRMTYLITDADIDRIKQKMRGEC
jgi:hypothetical protein